MCIRDSRKVEDLRERLGVQVMGPHGGQLNVDFSPKSAAVANKEANAAIAEAMKKFTQANPDALDDEPDIGDHHH